MAPLLQHHPLWRYLFFKVEQCMRHNGPTFSEYKIHFVKLSFFVCKRQSEISGKSGAPDFYTKSPTTATTNTLWSWPIFNVVLLTVRGVHMDGISRGTLWSSMVENPVKESESRQDLGLHAGFLRYESKQCSNLEKVLGACENVQ